MNLNKYDYITFESGEEGVEIAKIINIFKGNDMSLNSNVLDIDTYYSYSKFDSSGKVLEWTSFVQQKNKYGQFLNWTRSTATKEALLNRAWSDTKWIEAKIILRKYKILKLNSL